MPFGVISCLLVTKSSFASIDEYYPCPVPLALETCGRSLWDVRLFSSLPCLQWVPRAPESQPLDWVECPLPTRSPIRSQNSARHFGLLLQHGSGESPHSPRRRLQSHPHNQTDYAGEGKTSVYTWPYELMVVAFKMFSLWSVHFTFFSCPLCGVCFMHLDILIYFSIVLKPIEILTNI